MNNIFLLMLIATVCLYTYDCAVTEGYCHRVKRSNSMSNSTQTIKSNSTSTNTTKKAPKKDERPSNDTTKTLNDLDDEITTQIRSAIEKFKLKGPTTIHVRHMKLNRTEPAALRELRQGMEKDHCTDTVRHPKSLLLLNAHNAEEAFDDEHKKSERIFEFLKGKSSSPLAGESKHHHERYGRSFFVKDTASKKSKRNTIKSMIHHKLHRDIKDHKHKRAEGVESALEIIDSGNDADEFAPILGERLTELIYKPAAVDATSASDDIALFSPNDYFSNEFNGVPQPQHAVLPLQGSASCREYTLPLNFSPLKLITNAVESGISLSADKNENDSDEYEMTCPVHFKRSTDAISKDGSNGGVLELCTCHLYRKKKQVI